MGFLSVSSKYLPSFDNYCLKYKIFIVLLPEQKNLCTRIKEGINQGAIIFSLFGEMEKEWV